MYSVWAGATHSDAERSRLNIEGAACAVAVVAVTAFENARSGREKKRATEEAVQSTTKLALAYNFTLVPLSEQLAGIAERVPTPASASDPAVSASRSGILQLVLDSAAGLTAPADPVSGLPTGRSAFYTYDATNNSFVLLRRGGRGPNPRSPILVNTAPPGSDMYRVMDSGQANWDIKGSKFRTSMRPVGDYGSVIVAPVVCGPRRYGVLAVDAPKADDLTPAHVDLVVFLANLLATTLSLTS